MTYSLTFLQANTNDSLWLKCREAYDDFDPAQRGGPLMLFLLLKKIQDNSESAIESLKARVTRLKLRDIPGENVDTAVSLIRSTYAALESASRSDRNYIPDDFPQTVLKVFQTSSNASFNGAFKLEEQKVRHEADKTGTLPEWPTVHQTLNLATNMYGRMTGDGSWTQSNNKKSTFHAGGGGGNNQRQRGGTCKRKFTP